MSGIDREMLRGVPFLEGAGPELLDRLAAAALERRCQPGETVLEEGTTGREVYIIIEGQVEVVKGEGPARQVVARRGPGELFGEMGLIDGQPRSATIRALEPVRLVEFSEAAMRRLLAEQPALLYRAVQVLSARLRESDQHMIADLLRKNEELARAYRELEEAQAELVEKERLERELELAHDIQHSFLPGEFPCPEGFACAARYRPARQVGGDFYDVIPLDEKRVGLVMADVSDKGLPAALFMALSRSLIRAEARNASSARAVLLSVNRLLLEMSQSGLFVTVFYGILDVEQHCLQYARAGHDRPLLLRAGQEGGWRALEAEGIALGVVQDVALEEASVSLGPGDLLFLYTDGVTDASSPSGEFFGLDRLRDLALGAREADPQAVCDQIFEGVDRFRAGATQFDDMALLVVRAGTSEGRGRAR